MLEKKINPFSIICNVEKVFKFLYFSLFVVNYDKVKFLWKCQLDQGSFRKSISLPPHRSSANPLKDNGPVNPSALNCCEIKVYNFTQYQIIGLQSGMIRTKYKFTKSWSCSRINSVTVQKTYFLWVNILFKFCNCFTIVLIICLNLYQNSIHCTNFTKLLIFFYF